MNSWIDLHALWKIVVIGLLAGAGLPALFAVGLRALSAGPRTHPVPNRPQPVIAGRQAQPVSTGDDRVFGGSVPGLIAASACFAIVLAAIGLGIYSIVNGA